MVLLQRHLTQADWEDVRAALIPEADEPRRRSPSLVPWACLDLPADVREHAFALRAASRWRGGSPAAGSPAGSRLAFGADELRSRTGPAGRAATARPAGSAIPALRQGAVGVPARRWPSPRSRRPPGRGTRRPGPSGAPGPADARAPPRVRRRAARRPRRRAPRPRAPSATSPAVHQTSMREPGLGLVDVDRRAPARGPRRRWPRRSSIAATTGATGSCELARRAGPSPAAPRPAGPGTAGPSRTRRCARRPPGAASTCSNEPEQALPSTASASSTGRHRQPRALPSRRARAAGRPSGRGGAPGGRPRSRVHISGIRPSSPSAAARSVSAVASPGTSPSARARPAASSTRASRAAVLDGHQVATYAVMSACCSRAGSSSRRAIASASSTSACRSWRAGA